MFKFFICWNKFDGRLIRASIITVLQTQFQASKSYKFPSLIPNYNEPYPILSESVNWTKYPILSEVVHFRKTKIKAL